MSGSGGKGSLIVTDISVIILIGRERLHIRRCVERLAPLEPKNIFVVASQPDDGSEGIAREAAAACGLHLEVVRHAWPGLYAVQLNWAIENLPVDTRWVLRLDADEYLYPETCAEVKALLADGGLPDDVTALALYRARVFCGGRIRFGGTSKMRMVRIFRHGIGRCEDRAMDEHIVCPSGREILLKGLFADDNVAPMSDWREKHRDYARREAQDYLGFRAGRLTFRATKRVYYWTPRYVRVFGYFFLRYVLLLGFLDGRAGWMWNFWQGFWYRWLVDREITRALQTGDASTMVDLGLYHNRHSFGNRLLRLVWSVVWTFTARWTPRFVLNGYRALILRCFGAKIGPDCRLTSSMEVWVPSRLFVGRNVWIDRNVNLYDVERITIGDNAIVSDGAYICTAGHDIASRDFRLTTAPVTIGRSAWVAARAIVLPGVTIGEGAVVAAGAVVTRDVPPWTVVGGNPARVIRKREIRCSDA